MDRILRRSALIPGIFRRSNITPGKKYLPNWLRGQECDRSCPAAGSFTLYFLIQLTFGLDLACVSAMAVIRQRSKVKDVGQGKGQYECVCYTRIYHTPVSYEYFDRRP